jgi:hypothetical protein
LIPDFSIGTALNSYGEGVDCAGQPIMPQFEQGVLSFSLDAFCASFPEYFPTHLKIDVDGLEPKILQGARKTLLDARVKSILIEMSEDQKESLAMVDTPKEWGWHLAWRKHGPMFENSRWKSFYNYVFVRK